MVSHLFNSYKQLRRIDRILKITRVKSSSLSEKYVRDCSFVMWEGGWWIWEAHETPPKYITYAKKFMFISHFCAPLLYQR